MLSAAARPSCALSEISAWRGPNSHSESGTRSEPREHGLAGRVLREQRARKADPVLQRGRNLGRGDGFRTKNAVLVGERKADRFDLAALDLLQQLLHAALAAQGAR